MIKWYKISATLAIIGFLLAFYFRDANWAIAGLTFALVIITGMYAHSTYRLVELTRKQVDLIEKQGKTRIISGLSRKYLYPMRRDLRIIKKRLYEGEYITFSNDMILEVNSGIAKFKDYYINKFFDNKYLLSVN